MISKISIFDKRHNLHAILHLDWRQFFVIYITLCKTPTFQQQCAAKPQISHEMVKKVQTWKRACPLMSRWCFSLWWLSMLIIRPMSFSTQVRGFEYSIFRNYLNTDLLKQSFLISFDWFLTFIIVEFCVLTVWLLWLTKVLICWIVSLYGCSII